MHRFYQIAKDAWISCRMVWHEFKNERVNFIAAGVAFYLLVALVPGLGAIMAIYGLVADPVDVERQILSMHTVLPEDVMSILNKELKSITGDNKAAGWGVLVGIALALYGGSKAMLAIITAMNVVFHRPDGRKFFKKRLVAIVLTICGIAFFSLMVGLLVGVPAVVAYLDPGWGTKFMIAVMRWMVLLGVMMLWMSVIFRFAPYQRSVKWKWISWGTFTGTMMWMIASAGLTWYAAAFSNFNKTYGSLGAIVLLLFWFYMTGFSLMVGARVDAVRETVTDAEEDELGSI
ncbi:membrane protein [Rubritalea squalenifaciens DSM 18772]|uniref:Membrane protein n=1 Tax=Rubritalea squalenifaciens DSM 18772 TaxID=1123071 RepID=A0A1M6NSU2_9BACT|nr:YihY/virulence factor BrkB family protein [Rubritalea squalenifaciens]SHJ98698.1 membrane protein [Rubritalea squalenifaciens DSM 18772]